MRFIEEIGEDFGLLLPPVQPLSSRGLHRFSIPRTRLPQSTLDVAVEQFVGVQIRCVSRQKEHLDALSVLVHPVFDRFCSMRWVPVHDQKYFAPRLLDHPLAELYELIRLKATFEYHEA